MQQRCLSEAVKGQAPVSFNPVRPDDSGVVTYKSVRLDGVNSALNATVPSAFALGWSPTLLTNFQVDGIGASGSSTVYLDNLTLYRW